MQRFDRYVLRIFALHWLVIAAALLGLFSVLDLIGHGDELAQSSSRLDGVTGLAARYYLLNLPFLFVEFAPYLSLIAGLAATMHFARAREWTPVVTAGRSGLRAVLPIFLGAALLAAAAAATREIALPAAAAPREALKRQLFHQREWLMADLQARGRDDARLQAHFYLPARAELQGVEVYARAPDGRDRLILASSARWDGRGWVLENGFQVTGGLREPVARFDHPDLAPRDLERAYFAAVNPLDLSSGELREILARDPEHRQAATLIWAWRAVPFAHWILLCLGLPLVFRFDRRSALEGVAAGVLLSLLYFVADIVFRDLGGRGVLSPFFGGAGAALLFGGLGLWSLERMVSS